MIILGIDPGYAIVGVGVIDFTKNKFRDIWHGAITTPAGLDFSQRLKIIYECLDEVIETYRPEAVSVEELFFTTNQKTAIAVAQARGVILLAAVNRGVDLYEYTPLQVKQAVVGYGKAEKRQVMDMTKRILALSEIPRPDDVADALAIAICHAHSAGNPVTRGILIEEMRKKR